MGALAAPTGVCCQFREIRSCTNACAKPLAAKQAKSVLISYLSKMNCVFVPLPTIGMCLACRRACLALSLTLSFAAMLITPVRSSTRSMNSSSSITMLVTGPWGSMKISLYGCIILPFCVIL